MARPYVIRPDGSRQMTPDRAPGYSVAPRRGLPEATSDFVAPPRPATRSAGPGWSDLWLDQMDNVSRPLPPPGTDAAVAGAADDSAPLDPVSSAPEEVPDATISVLGSSRARLDPAPGSTWSERWLAQAEMDSRPIARSEIAAAQAAEAARTGAMTAGPAREPGRHHRLDRLQTELEGHQSTLKRELQQARIGRLMAQHRGESQPVRDPDDIFGDDVIG
jgi:hypothetical protein